MVETQPSKLMVRVRFPPPAPVDVFGSCSSGVEHTLGKGEVDGSIPSMSSIFCCRKMREGEHWLAFLMAKENVVMGLLSQAFLRYHSALLISG